jgi:hypothetical protein
MSLQYDDRTRVLTVAMGSVGDCCDDAERYRRIKSEVLRRMECDVSTWSSITSIGDQGWSIDRFLAACRDAVRWCDYQIDMAEPLGYVQSIGPGCY